MNITPSTYKDVPALACEANSLRARFLPEHGGKCASLVDLATGREPVSYTHLYGPATGFALPAW